MKGLLIVVSCALAACAARTIPPPLKSSGHAWLLFIDDMHLDFRNTGRLRDLLKMVANQVIKDGDAFMVRSSGPSQVAIEWTTDRSRLQSELRKATGNALKPSDIVDNGRRDRLFEVRYRAGIAMAFASELVSAARFGGRSIWRRRSSRCACWQTRPAVSRHRRCRMLRSLSRRSLSFAVEVVTCASSAASAV